MVDGTAIALQLGYRQSIDFDLFTFSKLNKLKIKQKINSVTFNKRLVFEDEVKNKLIDIATDIF